MGCGRKISLNKAFSFFFLEGGKGGKEVYKEKIIIIQKIKKNLQARHGETMWTRGDCEIVLK